MSAVLELITRQDNRDTHNDASPQPPQVALTQMLSAPLVTQALRVVAELGVADLLAVRARSVDELAAETGAHAPSLYRFMRALAGCGVFAETAGRVFELTPTAELLRADVEGSLRDLAIFMGADWHWQVWGDAPYSARTGRVAWEHVHGKEVFPYFAENTGAARVFDNAMTSFSNVVAQAVAGTYDFSQAKTIADIGGGHGLILSTVLQANPQAKGILFDQPYVVEAATGVLKNAGVEERVERIGGDFFSEVSVVADIYLMKFIIHDWNDEQSVTILKNLAKSAEPGAKVLLIETVVEEDDQIPSVSKLMDLNMLAMTGGKERTPSEYAALLEQTGFKLTNVIFTPSPLQIVEAVRV